MTRFSVTAGSVVSCPHERRLASLAPCYGLQFSLAISKPLKTYLSMELCVGGALLEGVVNLATYC